MIHDIIKLAHDVPRTRQYLVPIIRRHTASVGSAYTQMTGAKRNQYEEAVWSMFVHTYSRIGLSLSNPSQLYKYAVWGIALDKGQPVAFNLYKKTPFGLKSGLTGSDMSSVGRRITVALIRSNFLDGSVYGEVSHKVEAIAIAAGAPAVCTNYVSDVLGKPVKPLADGVHYVRSIPGVGPVTKILLGRPRGIPVTNPKNPVCSVAFNQPLVAPEAFDDIFDTLAHYACVTA